MMPDNLNPHIDILILCNDQMYRHVDSAAIPHGDINGHYISRAGNHYDMGPPYHLDTPAMEHVDILAMEHADYSASDGYILGDGQCINHIDIPHVDTL